MARVSVLGATLLENPSPFDHPLRFQVQFECGEALPHGESGEARRRHRPGLQSRPPRAWTLLAKVVREP